MKIALIIVGIILLLFIAVLGGYVLYAKHRNKKAEWFRVTGNVIGTKKLKFPSCYKDNILYRSPMSNKNAAGWTCLLTKPLQPKKNGAYDMMVYKDRHGKTKKILYPVRPGSNNVVQEVKVTKKVRK